MDVIITVFPEKRKGLSLTWLSESMVAKLSFYKMNVLYEADMNPRKLNLN